MIEAWRLTKAAYEETAFDGEGARRHGGRFNSEGTPLVYTAESLSLAVLEILANVPSNKHLRQHVARSVRFEERFMETLPREALPEEWQATPVPPSVQAIGDDWGAEERSLVLRVPSAVRPKKAAE